MRKIDKTIEYYNKNANLFVETTANVEFYHMQNRFLSKLETGEMCIRDSLCRSEEEQGFDCC